MKYIVILGDGMADLPCDALAGMTPLELAYKPNIDSLAQKGVCGMCKTVPDGIKPGSDVANLSVMGYSPLKYYSGRSPLEALSIGVNMLDSDLAVRCNLVTLSDEENYQDKSMIDYSAGEISTEEAAELIASVEQALGDDEFTFYNGVSYRHCLIKHNGERGTEYTPPHDISGKVIGDYLPSGLYGDKMLELMIKSYDILKNHPINLKRISEGKNPANSIWLWGEGSRPSLPNFAELRGLKGAVISAVDLLKGIGIASGMEVIEVEGVTGTLNTNFSGKAQACVKAIRDGFDYVYLHMEAPDECGHQGDSKGKVKSIELIDEKVVGYILNELEGEDLRILVCPDHPTPLVTKTHSSEPIPFIIYDSTCIKEGISAYTESECAKTGLTLSSGDELVELFLQKDSDMQEINENEENDLISSDLASDNEEMEVSSDEEIAEIADTSDMDENQQSDESNSAQTETDEESAVIAVDMNFVDDSSDKDSEGEKEEENAEGDNDSKKKGKKNSLAKATKKQKLITILVSAAVLAVMILVAVLTPILVINAPKVLINKAEDFTKPVKDNKQLYYLQKDITVEGDLTLSLNVDLNKKTLTVNNGTLTLENPKGGEMTLGVMSGKDFTVGGKINADKIVIKNASKVTVLTNITANEIEFDGVADGIVNGGLHANNSFVVKSSKVNFDSLAFGENISEMKATNANVVLNKPTKIDINLENSYLRALSDIGNATLDDKSELRLFGSTYNNFDANEFGTITGGKLVYVNGNGNFDKIIDAKVVWVDKDKLASSGSQIIGYGDLNYIDWLETPQFAVIERIGTNATLELSSVDALAKKVLVTIDEAKEPMVLDVKEDNISQEEGSYIYNLGAVLNSVGKHSIKVVLQSDEPEFITDSEPYYTYHTHYITLERVGKPQVIFDKAKNEYTLSFEAVDFAETYEVVFDGIVLTLKNEGKKKGEKITYILSEDEKFANLFTPGNHSIIIVAKSSVEGINSSAQAYANFPAIKGNLATPELSIELKDNNYIISWKNVENALTYELKFVGTDKTFNMGTGANQLVLSKEELEGIDSIEIVAIGSKYYENSATGTIAVPKA